MTGTTRSEPRTSAPADPPPERDVPAGIVLLALGAVVVGVVARFVTRSPLWLDEALSVNIARLPLSEIPGALRHDGHPPLYYGLLHVWMSLFGTGDAAVRSLSGLMAVASLPLAWITGRRRGGALLGWLFIGVLAVSPFALRYATETRMYSLVMTLVLAGYLLVDDVVRRGRDGTGRLIALAAVSGSLLLTHYWSMWLFGSVGVVLLWLWRRGAPDKRRPALRAGVAVAAGGLLFLPWVPSFLYQAAHTGTPWAGSQRPTYVLAATLKDFGGGDFVDAQLVGAVLLILALLALFGRGVDHRHIDVDLATRAGFRVEAIVVVLTLGVGVAVTVVTNSAYATRYAAVFFPLVALMVAGGIACFVPRRALLGVFATVVALSMLGVYWNATFPRTQGRVDAGAINSAASPGDLVVFCPDQLGPAFSRSLRRDLATAVYPTLGTPDRVDWVDYAARNRAADPAKISAEILRRAGPGRIFLVWQGDYRTFQHQCEAVVDTLGAARPGAKTLVASGGKAYFEPAAVTMFPPGR